MRTFEHLETYRRQKGKGKGRTFEIPMGHGRHCGKRLAVCRLDGAAEPFGLAVTMMEKPNGRFLQTPRCPTLDELAVVRSLFYHDHEVVTVRIGLPDKSRRFKPTMLWQE